MHRTSTRENRRLGGTLACQARPIPLPREAREQDQRHRSDDLTHSLHDLV